MRSVELWIVLKPWRAKAKRRISCGHGKGNLQYWRGFLGILFYVTLVEFQLTVRVSFILLCCPAQLNHQSLVSASLGQAGDLSPGNTALLLWFLLSSFKPSSAWPFISLLYPWSPFRIILIWVGVSEAEFQIRIHLSRTSLCSVASAVHSGLLSCHGPTLVWSLSKQQQVGWSSWHQVPGMWLPEVFTKGHN